MPCVAMNKIKLAFYHLLKAVLLAFSRVSTTGSFKAVSAAHLSLTRYKEARLAHMDCCLKAHYSVYLPSRDYNR